MKLRNKMTGEIIESACIGVFRHKSSGDCERVDTEARSLEKVLEEWEDYEEPKPLIKNAGMREVLRLWAKVNLIPSNATTIEYHLAETLTGTETEFWDNNLHIMFYGNIAPGAVHGKIYTIDELCGKEEE